MSVEEKQAMQIVVAPMKVLLLQTLTPKGVAGLGGLVSASVAAVRRQHSRASGIEVVFG